MTEGKLPNSQEVAASTLDEPSNDAPKTINEEGGCATSPDTELGTPPDNPGHLTGPKLYFLVLALSSAFFLMTLNSTIVVTAVPSITTRFHSLNDVGWYGSAYLLTNCAIQPITGKIYKHHSLKYTFLVFLGLFELGSLLCGVSVSSNMFIIGRAVAGSGASGILNGSLTIMSATIPLEKRPGIIGFAMSYGMLGQIMGPLIGGALTEHATWRWCFFLNLPLGGAVALLLFFTRIPDERQKENWNWRTTIRHLDLLGFVTFAPTIIMFLLALNWGGTEHPWNSAIIIGLLCGAAGLFCVFLCCEYYKGDEASIPFSLFRQRILVASFCNQMLQAGAIMQMTYFLPLWFQTVKNDTPTLSGVDILPTIASQIVLSATCGMIVQRLGYYLPFAILGGSMTAIGTGLLTTLTPSSSVAHWAGFQIITGGGRGFASQQPSLAISAVLSKDQIAVGNSVLAFSMYLGGAVFVSAGNNVMNGGLVKYLHQMAPNVNPDIIVNAGATHFRNVVDKADLPSVLLAYNHAITRTFYIAAASASCAAVAASGMGWVSVKKVKAKPKPPVKSPPPDLEKAQ